MLKRDAAPPSAADELNPVERLTRDLANAAVTLTDTEARFLVDSYYAMQDNRIRAAGQIRSMQKSKEPHAVLTWLEQQSSTLENQIKRALEKYVNAHPVGDWLMAVHGIGPVIAAGLLAHIDINRAPTVGHIWAFGGYDPSKKWEKGKKRPFNASLKVLFWKAGQSFMKFHNDKRCFYGHLYRDKKQEIAAANERGAYADAASETLARFNYRKETEAYKWYSQGKLPPAHVDARARRYAVKIFLSHLHAEMYRRILKQEPPVPFAMAHMGHAHVIYDPQSSES